MRSPHPDIGTLMDYANGVLAPNQRAALRAHLDGCLACRQAFASVSGPITSPNLAAAPKVEGVTARADPLVGRTLGEYRIIERLAFGGMGVLYRGEQPVIGKPVAIKVLHPQMARDPNLVERLIREARAVNAIRHPNIVDIFSFGKLEDGREYIVMELLDGESLASILRQRLRLEPDEVLMVLDQALSALEAAHAHDVIHRDLKPENVFVNPLKEGWRVTLLDFGAAKPLREPNLTDPDILIGTPSYMSPEMIRGEPLTPKLDIYALGVMSWYLLSGYQPFVGESSVEVMRAHIEKPIPRLPLFRTDTAGTSPRTSPQVAGELEQLVDKMMSKNPNARPTAAEARREVMRIKRSASTVATLKAVPVPAPPAPKPEPVTLAAPLVALAQPSHLRAPMLEAITIAAKEPGPPMRTALATQPGRPKFEETSAPIELPRSNTGLLAVLVFLLAVGAGAAFWWFFVR